MSPPIHTQLSRVSNITSNVKDIIIIRRTQTTSISKEGKSCHDLAAHHYLSLQVTEQVMDEKIGRMVTRVVLPRVVMHSRHHYAVFAGEHIL